METLGKKERAEVIAKAMRDIWSSLESHLDWAANLDSPPPDDADFHAECVQSYAQTLVDIAKLY